MSGRSSRWVRFAAVVALVGLMAGMLPARVLATRDGGSFESEAFGVTFTWDEGIWSASPADIGNRGEGVSLESLTSYGQLQAVTVADAVPETCVQDLADVMGSNTDGHVQNFKRASRRIERPQAFGGGASELYAFTYVVDAGSLDNLLYLGCVPLANGSGTLQIIISTDADAYDDVLPEWNGLIGGISTDGDEHVELPGKAGPRPGKTAATTGIEGETYTNVEYGYALSWDGQDWSPTEIGTHDSAGVQLEAAASFAYIFSIQSPRKKSAGDCLQSLADNLESQEGYTRFKVAASTFERPEAPETGIGELYTFTVDGSKMAAYLECRLLPNQSLLAIQFASTAADYETELPKWQAVLDTVTIGEADDASNDAPAKKTPAASADDDNATTNTDTVGDVATITGKESGGPSEFR